MAMVRWFSIKCESKKARLVADKPLLRKSVANIELNAAQSPFFRLTPEARNEIYDLVLGKDWKLWVAGFSVWEYHLPDGTVFRSSYDLSLLRVCRQINKEAALLPFQSNTLQLACRHLEDFLLWRLVPAQRNAITSLVLRDEEMTESFWNESLSKELSGLRKLKLVVDAQCRPLEKFERLALELEKLRNGRLNEVTIEFMSQYYLDKYPKRRAILDDWATRLKAKLLLPVLLEDKSVRSEYAEEETKCAAAAMYSPYLEFRRKWEAEVGYYSD